MSSTVGAPRAQAPGLPACVAERQGSRGTQRISLRPRLLYVIGLPALLYPVYLFAEDRGWDLKVWCVLVGLSYPILHALRGRLVLEDSALRTRGVRQWSPPVDLDRLRAVGTFRSAGLALHVYVEDESGESMLLVPRYWVRWRRLRAVLAEHVDRSGLAVGSQTASHLRLEPALAPVS